MTPLALWVVFAACITAVAATTFVFTLISLVLLHRKVRALMGAIQDAVDAVVVQLGKAKAEVVAKIADLEAQLAAGETPDLTALKAAAQALDDVVVDVPAEEPVVEEAAEAPAE